MSEGKMEDQDTAHASASPEHEQGPGDRIAGDASAHSKDNLTARIEPQLDERPLVNEGANDEPATAVEPTDDEREEALEAAAPKGEVTDGVASPQNGDVVMTDEAATAGAQAINNLSIEATPKPDDKNQSASKGKATKRKSTPFDPEKCVTCQEKPGKYKCPRCLLKYCSVACNKLHKPTHDNEAEPPKPAPQTAAHPADEASQEKIGLHGRKLKHPYKTLEHSEELKWLFNKYPRLPEILLDIYGATEPPPTARSRIPASLLMALPENRQHDNSWSQEKRIFEGRSKLREVRSGAGEDSEAVREYCLLVSSLLNEAKDR